MDMEKTARNLEQRGFVVHRFATGAEAAAYLTGEIRDTSVGIGGSKTAEQLGLYEKLSEHNEVFWHWRVPGMETLLKATAAPVYITGANAVSESGEILNIDGNGNRLAAQVFGAKRVYVLAGKNKLCPDFDSALRRAREVAAVQNVKRFPDKKTPCQLDGACHDCRSADRICRALLVLWAPMFGMHTEVLLIDENLGM